MVGRIVLCGSATRAGFISRAEPTFAVITGMFVRHIRSWLMIRAGRSDEHWGAELTRAGGRS